MPIYEYACGKCEHEFEVEQRISDDPVKTCPKCRSRRVKRLISQTSFVLKGGGWYSDLYSSPQSEKKSEKPDGESKGSEEKKSPKKESSDSGSAGDSKSGSKTKAKAAAA